MRNFLILIVIGGLGALYVWQKKSDAPESTPKVPVNQTAASQPGPQATPKGDVSEHNWMKRSIDRARDVTQQSRARTKDSQDP